jgi:hypothetical protein
MKKIFYQSTGFLSAICGSLFITLPAIPQTALAQQQQQPSVSPTSQVNPCPSIFYLEPHNSRVLVPQGCPPNAYTQKQKKSSPSSAANPPASNQQKAPASSGETPSAPTVATTGSSSLNPCPSIFYDPRFYRRSFVVRQGCPAKEPAASSQGSSSQTAIPARPQENVTQPPAPEEISPAVATVTPINGKVSVRLKNNTNAPISYQAIGHTGQRLLSGKQQVVLRDLSLPVTITAVHQDKGLLRITPTASSSGVLELNFNEATDLKNSKGAIRIRENGDVYLN